MRHHHAATFVSLCTLVLAGCDGRAPATEPRPSASLSVGVAAFEPYVRVPSCLELAPGCSSGILLAGPDAAGPELNAPNALGASCPDQPWPEATIESIEVATLDGAPMSASEPVEVVVRVAGSDLAFVQLWYSPDALAPLWQPLRSSYVDLGAGREGLVGAAATYALPPAGLQAIRATIGPADASGCSRERDTDDLAFAVGSPLSRYSLITSPAEFAVVTGDVPLAIVDLGTSFTHVEYVVEDTVLVSEAPPWFPAVWPSASRAEAAAAMVHAYVHAPDGQYVYGEVPVTVAASAACDPWRGIPMCTGPSSSCGSSREAQGGPGFEACGPWAEPWLGCPEFPAAGSGPWIEHIVVRSRDGGPLGPGVAARIDVELGGLLPGDPIAAPLGVDVYLLEGDPPGRWTLLGTADPAYTTRDVPMRVAAPTYMSSDPLSLRYVRAVLRSGGWPGYCDASVLDDDVLAFAAPDTAPPAIALVVPAEGEAIVSPLWLSAVARDAGGVGCVSFLVDDVPAGWACAPPYQVPVELSPGVHRLAAAADDLSGNRAQSAPISVYVDAMPPAIGVLTPAPDAILHGVTEVSLAVSDDDRVASVELELDGSTLAFIEAPPWTYPWDTTTSASGNHTLRAIAVDAAGFRSSTPEIPLRVDQLPAVQLVAPLDGEQAYGPATLAAVATDDLRVASVELLVDGATVATLAEPPYETVWAPGALGEYRVAARACDEVQCSVTAEARITFSLIVPVDTAAPVVALTSPARGAAIVGPVTLEAVASDDVGVTGVSFYADGDLVGRDDAPPYAVPWYSTPYQGRAVTLLARASDAAGHVGESAPLGVTVPDVTAPKVALTAPLAGATLFKTAELEVAGSDNVAVTRVEYYADGQLVGTVTQPPFALVWEVRKVDRGAHTLVALARDAAGNVASSGEVPVTVK
jgi:hypothetical protein